MSRLTNIDRTPRAVIKGGSSSPVVPEQRHQFDGSLTQQRVDAIFRALVVRRALERRAKMRDQDRTEG